jgi:phage terminase large subunit-like protein
VRYLRSLGEIHLSTGSRIFIRSADEPDRLRGHNLAGAWCDELALFRYGERLWHEALMPAVRVAPAKIVATTTPRPVPVLKTLLARDDGSVVVVRGSTFDNADNLSRSALRELRARYEGTRLGRAELGGELLEDVEGALFSLSVFEQYRVDEAPDLLRVVIGVDPSTTAGGDLCGIVVAGVAGTGPDAHFFILEDASLGGSPKKWANRVAAMYAKHNADRIVAESNQGGQMVEDTLRAVHSNLPVRTVHASRSKQVRAEPVAALAEQGRLHVVGVMAELEEECCTWIPNMSKSPDRLDAMVYAVSALAEGRRKARMMRWALNESGETPPAPACPVGNPTTTDRGDPMVVGPPRRPWP